MDAESVAGVLVEMEKHERSYHYEEKKEHKKSFFLIAQTRFETPFDLVVSQALLFFHDEFCFFLRSRGMRWWHIRHFFPFALAAMSFSLMPFLCRTCRWAALNASATSETRMAQRDC